MVQRSVPDCGSVPIIDSIMPKQAAQTPRSGALPDSVDTIEMPKTEIASSSGEPRYKMTGRKIGRLIPIRNAPKMPPIIADR